jgi:hypothetical protein
MKVFLSYAEPDRQWAGEVARHLVDAKLTVEDPALEVLPGDNWADKFSQALEKSDAVVVLLSPDSTQSSRIRHEIQYALGSPQFKDRLIPVLVRETRGYPWILNELNIIEPHDPAEAAEQIIARLTKRPSGTRTKSRAAR